jgi:hypothetical protein
MFFETIGQDSTRMAAFHNCQRLTKRLFDNMFSQKIIFTTERIIVYGRRNF